MRRALEAYIKDSQSLLIEDILTTVNDEIYRLGLCEAVRFASDREVGVFGVLPPSFPEYFTGVSTNPCLGNLSLCLCKF